MNLRNAFVKGVRTFTQTLAGVLLASGTGLLDAPWEGALSAAGMSGLIAALMNVSESDSNETVTNVMDSPNDVDTDTGKA